MERETRKVTLAKSGKELEIKSYVTAREKRSLEAVFFEGQSVSVESDGSRRMAIPAALVQRAQEKAVELLVVSFDGSAERVLDRILDLPADHADEVFGEVDKVSGSLDHEKKD